VFLQDGKTPIFAAIENGRQVIAYELLDAGADVTKPANVSASFVQIGGLFPARIVTTLWLQFCCKSVGILNETFWKRKEP